MITPDPERGAPDQLEHARTVIPASRAAWVER